MFTGGNGHIARAAAAAAALAVALVLALAAGAAGAGVGSWAATGPTAVPWNGGAMLRLTDGRVLALPYGSEETELYDPASDAWSPGPTRPSSATNATPIALPDGGALLVGGIACPATGHCVPAATAQRWRPGTPAWAPTAPPREARTRPIVAALADGRILALGGFGDNCTPTFANGWSCSPIASAEVYDPVADAWSETAPMPAPRAGAAAATLSDGTVLVVGGAGDGRDAIRYLPASGTWRSAGQTAASRTGGTLVALPHGRALAFGGDVPYADFYGSLGGAGMAAPPRCDPSAETFASDSWTPAPTEPGGTTNCPSSALLADGQVLVASVPSRFAESSPSPFSVLDAQQRCWTPTTPPPQGPTYATAVSLRDGRALVLGDGLSTALLYTPGSPACASPPPPRTRPPFRGVVVPRSGHVRTTLHALVVPLQCLGAVGRCLGRVSVALLPERGARRGRERTLGRARFAIATGKSVTLRFRVRRGVRARLLGHAFVDLAVHTIARDGAGRRAAWRSVLRVAVSQLR